jgi:dihydroorotate dehydrogenase electron transfer subunit
MIVKMEMPKLVKIKKITEENAKVKTFLLDVKIDAKPGQFLMVWIKDVDEKPFSLSGENAITVEKKGEFTEAMFKLREGDEVGVRGPYGNGFSLKKDACVVAGGLGLAPLKPVIEDLKNPTVICGAKTEKDFIFKGMFDAKMCTDDGSAGHKGFTTDLLKDMLKEKKFSVVYACGPEIMLKKVFEICEENNVECEISLERFFKCGIGICGQCCIDDQMVCKDGPVFNSEQLRKLSELGKFARLKTGKMVKLEEYFNQG